MVEFQNERQNPFLLLQFQESADITVQDEKITIRRNFSYFVSLSNKTGWLRIEKLWTFDDVLNMEGTCFTRPPMGKHKKNTYGQVCSDRTDLTLMLKHHKQ